MDEYSQRVPGTPERTDILIKKTKEMAVDLGVVNRLSAYREALHVVRENENLRGGYYYLMLLNPSVRSLQITAYRKNQLDEATHAYGQMEQRIAEDRGSEAVLVSVDSIKSLEQAYPNYFLDTTRFLKRVESLLRA